MVSDELISRLPFDVSVLTKHCMVVGSTGSGKTVACKDVVEETLLSGVPVIAIDPQGDIASMAQRTRDERWNREIDVTVWTPGVDAGFPFPLDPVSFPTEFGDLAEDTQAQVVALVASTTATMLGYDPRTAAGRGAIAVMDDVMMRGLRDHNALPAGLEGLMALVKIGDGEHLVTKGALNELLRRLAQTQAGSRAYLSLGPQVTIPDLLGHDLPITKTRLSVVYLTGLASPHDRMAVVQYILAAMYSWMLVNPSRRLQALLYVDEVAEYLPAGVRKTAAKPAFTLMLRQGRKYGIGCLLATQSPGDIDYKCVGQVNTWVVGRTLTQQGRKKLEHIYAAHGEKSRIEELPRLPVGKFQVLCPDAFPGVREHDFPVCRTAHGAPLTEREIARVTDEVAKHNRLARWEHQNEQVAAAWEAKRLVEIEAEDRRWEARRQERAEQRRQRERDERGGFLTRLVTWLLS